MIVIGITGNFGSGKSTVAAMFKKRGARVIDADAVVRDLILNDERCRCAIRGVFGDRVVTKNEVDRSKLAIAAFSDRRLLKKLEAILHPLVKEKFMDAIGKCRGKMIVLDVPLLIEAGWSGMVDAVIVVRATVNKEVLRLNKRSGHSRAEVLKRLKYQLPFRDKRRFADFIVDNRESLGDTDKQVKKIFDSLIKKNH
jgi:dephospho-CoA kinase